MKKLTSLQILGLLLAAKLLLHFSLNAGWSFHRDELLYLALGRNLDWGYASVPAGIGFWAWLGSEVLGGSVWARNANLEIGFADLVEQLQARTMRGGSEAAESWQQGHACLLDPRVAPRPALVPMSHSLEHIPRVPLDGKVDELREVQ